MESTKAIWKIDMHDYNITHTGRAIWKITKSSDPNLSSTTLAILKYAKSGNADSDWQSIVDNVLGKIYHEDMKLNDVMHIMLSSLKEVSLEPRFEVNFGSLYYDIIMSPTKFDTITNHYPRLESEYNIEEFYNTILREILSKFRFTRADWLVTELKEIKL